MEISENFKVLKKEKDEVVIEILFSTDDIYFDGHFEGFPILPGLIQLKLLSTIIKNNYDSEFVLNKIPNVKFMIPIFPEDKVQIKVNRGNENYKFEISKSSNLCAKGILCHGTR